MNIPADLQVMYDHYLDLTAKNGERAPVSQEIADLILTLIERIAELETDSKNLNSYIHFECRRNQAKEN
jgi:hypothetical protein